MRKKIYILSILTALMISNVASGEKKYSITIPENVSTMWVFLQDTGEGKTCEEMTSTDGITPKVFIERFDEFHERAEKNPEWDLVVTARTENKIYWPHGDIKVSGFRTIDEVKYYCNKEEGEYGAALKKR